MRQRELVDLWSFWRPEFSEEILEIKSLPAIAATRQWKAHNRKSGGNTLDMLIALGFLDKICTKLKVIRFPEKNAAFPVNAQRRLRNHLRKTFGVYYGNIIFQLRSESLEPTLVSSSDSIVKRLLRDSSHFSSHIKEGVIVINKSLVMDTSYEFIGLTKAEIVKLKKVMEYFSRSKGKWTRLGILSYVDDLRLWDATKRLWIGLYYHMS